MKSNLPTLAVIFVLAAPLSFTSCSKESIASETGTPGSPAAPADAGAEFLAQYRKALAARDTATLDSFLLTEGTPAEVVEFFKMMRDMPAEGTVTVELQTPSAEDAAKFNKPQEMPDGKLYSLPLTPSHQLVITSEVKDGSSTSQSTSSFPVAQKDGRFVIPLPVPVK